MVRRTKDAAWEARKAEIAKMVDRVQAAIAEGRVYLNTFVGRLKVTAYNRDTGWASTGGDYLSRRSFMVCVSDFEIEPAER